MKSLKILVIFVLITVSFTITVLAEAGGTGTVTSNCLNVRKEASFDSEVQDTVVRGTSVLIIDTPNNEWYQVYYNGSTGYMAAEYLAVNKTAQEEYGTINVKDGNVFLKAGASGSSAIIKKLNGGATLRILGVDDNWYYVEYGEQLGYVRASAVDFSVAAQAYASSSGAIVTEAMNYLGVRYVYGGTSPSGFDCSGLVYYIYSHYGYTVNRTAASLMGCGAEVESLIPGDMVFFANGGRGRVGHVGIYIGDNQFIHACSGSGRVQVSSLDEKYYARYYCGARRIVEG